MQDFGGADGIEDLHAKALFETSVDGGRQGFAGRDSISNGGEIELAAIIAVIGKQGGKIRWNGEEQPGSATLDGFKHLLRLGRSGIQNTGGADGKREVEPIAQSVGEEKFGRTEATIGVGDIKDGLGV